MHQSCTSGSVGARGGQLPRATRPSTVGERADLEQRVEPIALQHETPVDWLVAEVVGPSIERLLPAGREQLVDLAAGLCKPANRREPAPRGPSCRECGR
jgi:hypothetical protein